MGCLPLSHNHHDRDRQTDPRSSTPSLFSESTSCFFGAERTARVQQQQFQHPFWKVSKTFLLGNSFPELEYVTTAQIKRFNYGHYSRFTQWSICCIHSCSRFWSHLKTSSDRATVFLMEKLLMFATEIWQRQNSLHTGFGRWAHYTPYLKKPGV